MQQKIIIRGTEYTTVAEAAKATGVARTAMDKFFRRQGGFAYEDAVARGDIKLIVNGEQVDTMLFLPELTDRTRESANKEVVLKASNLENGKGEIHIDTIWCDKKKFRSYRQLMKYLNADSRRTQTICQVIKLYGKKLTTKKYQEAIDKKGYALIDGELLSYEEAYERYGMTEKKFFTSYGTIVFHKGKPGSKMKDITLNGKKVWGRQIARDYGIPYSRVLKYVDKRGITNITDEDIERLKRLKHCKRIEVEFKGMSFCSMKEFTKVFPSKNVYKKLKKFICDGEEVSYGSLPFNYKGQTYTFSKGQDPDTVEEMRAVIDSIDHVRYVSFEEAERKVRHLYLCDSNFYSALSKYKHPKVRLFDIESLLQYKPIQKHEGMCSLYSASKIRAGEIKEKLGLDEPQIFSLYANLIFGKQLKRKKPICVKRGTQKAILYPQEAILEFIDEILENYTGEEFKEIALRETSRRRSKIIFDSEFPSYKVLAEGELY